MSRVRQPGLYGAALIVQALVLGWLLSQPLYWAFHFEYALAANLTVLVVGGLGALGPLSAHYIGVPEIARTATRVVVPLVLSLSLALLAQLVMGSCDAGEGLAWFALIPGVGGVLVMGEVLCLRALTGSRGRMVVLHLAVILGALALMGARAYFGLSFRLYNVFLGYWPGVLYDEFVPIEWPIVLARAQALLLGLALLALGAGVMLRKPIARIAGVSALVLFALSFLPATGAGIHPWRGSVADELGVVFEGRHVRWIAQGKVPRVAQALPVLAARADYQAERVAERLGISQLPQMTVYLFASAEHKRRVIGAAQTVVTRPWRGELYLHISSRTHQVLRHELVHLIAADWAWPGVGISPNIALLEGLAVSQEQSLEGRYNPQGLARAVMEQKPDFDLAAFLSGVQFWALSPRVAYPMAGAFVSFLLDSEVLTGSLKDFYRTGAPENQSIEELSAAWWEQLQRAPAPTPAEHALARRVLAARALHEKRCAHEVAECIHAATSGAWQADSDGADTLSRLVGRALRLDPHRADVRAFHLQIEANAGNLADVEAALPRDPAGDEPPTHEQLAAAQIYARHQLATENFDAALAWLDFRARWSADLVGFWNAWIAASLARSGGTARVERADGAWALECTLTLGRAICSEVADVFETTDDGQAAVVEVSLLLFEEPEVEFAAAYQQYLEHLLSGRAAEAEKWAARMAQVEGISPERRERALAAEAEASWLAGAMETYTRKAGQVLP